MWKWFIGVLKTNRFDLLIVDINAHVYSTKLSVNKVFSLKTFNVRFNFVFASVVS